MKRIDSGALTLLDRFLRLAGAGGSQNTDLDDAVVSQVLEINPVVRRSLAPGPDGIFVGVYQNAHAGASSLSTVIDPYRPDWPANEWPNPLPDHFDVWLLGSVVQVIAGGDANYGTSELEIGYNVTDLGWSENDTGTAPVAPTMPMPVAYWDAVVAMGGSGTFGLTEQGETYKAINMRLPKGPAANPVNLTFASISTGVVTVQCTVLLQLVPTTSGTDAVI